MKFFSFFFNAWIFNQGIYSFSIKAECEQRDCEVGIAERNAHLHECIGKSVQVPIFVSLHCLNFLYAHLVKFMIVCC